MPVARCSSSDLPASSAHVPAELRTKHVQRPFASMSGAVRRLACKNDRPENPTQNPYDPTSDPYTQLFAGGF